MLLFNEETRKGRIEGAGKDHDCILINCIQFGSVKTSQNRF